MTTYYMGITALHHDSSVALITDQGVIVNAAKESSFTGIAGDKNWPKEAIAWSIKDAKARGHDIKAKDVVYNYYENPWVKMTRKVVNNPKKFLAHLKEAKVPQSYIKKLNFVPHHDSHALTAIKTSPFHDGYYLIADGAGDNKSTSWGSFSADGIVEIGSTKYPHSLGVLRVAIMDMFNMRPNRDEWIWESFSGVAKTEYIDKIKTLFKMTEAGFELLPNVHNKGVLQTLFGDHVSLTEIGSIAKSVDAVILNILGEICTKQMPDKTKPLVFGGGLANAGSLATGLGAGSGFNTVWVPPFPGNGGSAIGAAFAGIDVRSIDYHTHYHGPVVDECIKPSTTLLKNVSKRLEAGEVVMWMQGPEEFSTNGLGHRLILADPRNEDACRKMSVINGKPTHHVDSVAVLAEMANSYFDGHGASVVENNMFNYPLRNPEAYPGVINQAKVLPVSRGLDCFRSLLSTWSNSTNCDILACNNLTVRDAESGDFVIGTRQHAMDFLLTSDVDCLVIGNRVYYKIMHAGIDESDSSLVANFDDYSLGTFN